VCPVGRDRVASGSARAGGVGDKTREKTTTDLGDSAPESRARASVSSADAGRASLDAPARFPSPSRTAPAASARRSSPPTPGERDLADSVWSAREPVINQVVVSTPTGFSLLGSKVENTEKIKNAREKKEGAI
jgi:hypothetical protein